MGYLRLVAPLERAGIEIVRGYEEGETFPERVSEGDLVIIQRHFPVRYAEYQEVIQRARAKNKPIVFELDDLLFYLPEQHPDRLEHFYTPSLLPMFQTLIEADLVTVPTSPLKEALSPYNDNIVVLPNFLDDQLWRFREPLVDQSSDRPIIIGYMGTKSHQPDLELILPALVEMIHLYPSKIRLSFWGIDPPQVLKSFSNIDQFPWISYCYREFAEFFQSQQADIFVAPLVNHGFNRCKSPLKFYEYSALGVPGIYSDLEPYRHVVQNGVSGYLATSLDDWKMYLIMLIENPELRANLAKNAQETIKQKLTLSKNAFIWRETYQKLLEQYAPRQPRPIYGMIHSINWQLHKLLTWQKQEMERLRTVVSGQEQEMERLRTVVSDQEQEIIGYVTSRSWRYTRPFRKIRRLLRNL